MPDEGQAIRLDRWLWAARFYKTRALAQQAITGGKVHYNDERVKPSKAVAVGATLTISKNGYQHTIIVDQLSNKRGSAKVAATLYHETAESLDRNRKQREQQRISGASYQVSKDKPTKKQRREQLRVKRGE